MLDLTGIMFSSVMILMVIIRAIQADRAQPWFQRIEDRVPAKHGVQHTWKRRD